MAARAARSESPPRAKKSSARPIPSTPRRAAQAAASASSTGPSGGAYPARTKAPAPGEGRAARSTFPLGVSGSASSRTYAPGTMKAGSRAARWARSAPGSIRAWAT